MEMTSMQIWDHNDALERVLDNHDLLQQLVQLFLDSIPEQVADFQRAFSQHDFASIRTLAHTLKGVASNLSTHQLNALAIELETAAHHQQWEQILGLWPQLQTAYQQVQQVLTAYITDNATP